MLDHTTQDVSRLSYTGKLGFAQRNEKTLTIAARSMIQTLDEFGHSVDQFQVVGTHRIMLECEHIEISLRHRRGPTPMRQNDGTACRSQLELAFCPRFPDHMDPESCELLLARTLFALVVELDVSAVEWLDYHVALTPEMFADVFMTAGVAADDILLDSAEHVYCDIQLPVDTEGAEPVSPFASTGRRSSKDGTRVTASLFGRKPAKSVFAPIDETVGPLALHCDRIIERRDPKGQEGNRYYGTRSDRSPLKTAFDRSLHARLARLRQNIETMLNGVLSC